MPAELPYLTEGDPRPLVLLVEDEVLVRATLASMLQASDFKVIPVANADEANVILAETPRIDVVVTDINLASGTMDGLALARKVWDERKIGVIVVSGQGTPQPADLPPEIYFIAKPVHRATLAHLVSSLISSAEQPNQPADRDTIATPAPTNITLTPRQYDVLDLLAQGKSNREIAEALNLSEGTIKVHLAAIFRAFGVSSRVEAVLASMRLLPRS